MVTVGSSAAMRQIRGSAEATGAHAACANRGVNSNSSAARNRISAFLFPHGRHAVRDRGAMQIANLGFVVCARAVHGATIVPHHQIAGAQVVRVNESRLCSVFDQVHQRQSCLGVFHAECAPRATKGTMIGASIPDACAPELRYRRQFSIPREPSR